MRRRKLRWQARLALVVILTFVAIALWPRPSQVTEANCIRLWDGTTHSEGWAGS
jgi:hypothetical protein